MFIAGIVGARSRNSAQDRAHVFAAVKRLQVREGSGLLIVSGGCPKGADHFAEEAAKAYGVPVRLHLPDKKALADANATKAEWAQAFYARNTLVAEDCTELFALVQASRKGGTEDTIRKALALGKTCWINGMDGKWFKELPKSSVRLL